MYLVAGTQAEIIALCIEMEQLRHRQQREEEEDGNDNPQAKRQGVEIGQLLKANLDHLRKALEAETDLYTPSVGEPPPPES